MAQKKLNINIEDEVLEENKITQEIIDNLSRPYFHLITNESVVEYIHYYCKNLLKYSMNRHNSKEVAYAINLNKLKFEGAEIGNSYTIDITYLVEKIDNSDCLFIVLHNHPSNNTFSVKDIETFIAAQNMAILMVLGNNGAMYIMEKMLDIKSDRYELHKVLIDYRTGKATFDDTINKLSVFGIKYTCI